MKPYYEEAGITIYNADCREILPQLGAVRFAVSRSAKYGIGIASNPVHQMHDVLERVDAWSNGQLLHKFGGEAVFGDDEDFNPIPFLNLSENTILWGAIASPTNPTFLERNAESFGVWHSSLTSDPEACSSDEMVPFPVPYRKDCTRPLPRLRNHARSVQGHGSDGSRHRAGREILRNRRSKIISVRAAI